MSRLTRDGTAEPVSRDQILRHARGQGNAHFPCSADHEQDWQPYPVDPYSAICDDHTYIHTYSAICDDHTYIHTLLYVMTIHTYIHICRTIHTYYRDSAGTGPIVLNAVRATDAAFSGFAMDQIMCASLFSPHPLLV